MNYYEIKFLATVHYLNTYLYMILNIIRIIFSFFTEFNYHHGRVKVGGEEFRDAHLSDKMFRRQPAASTCVKY